MQFDLKQERVEESTDDLTSKPPPTRELRKRQPKIIVNTRRKGRLCRRVETKDKCASSVCKRKFESGFDLKQHVTYQEKPYKCDHCESTFRRENVKRKHEEKMHSDVRTESKETKDMSNISVQMDGSKGFGKVCPICGKKFKRAIDLEGHVNIHLKVKPFQCGHCDATFCRENAKKKHERRHTGEKPYQCSSCGMMFIYEGQLKKHEISHSGQKPYKCSFCDKRFAWSEQIKIHERIHTGERPYQCSFCGKTFQLGEHLRRHERLHTGEKPYKCSHCGKAFTQEWHMKSHEKTHTGDKPYKCAYCEKRFIQHSNLKAHERTHTGEKPYKCKFCSKAYSDLKSKKKHQAQLCQWRNCPHPNSDYTLINYAQEFTGHPIVSINQSMLDANNIGTNIGQPGISIAPSDMMNVGASSLAIGQCTLNIIGQPTCEKQPIMDMTTTLNHTENMNIIVSDSAGLGNPANTLILPVQAPSAM